MNRHSHKLLEKLVDGLVDGTIDIGQTAQEFGMDTNELHRLVAQRQKRQKASQEYGHWRAGQLNL